MKNAIASVEIYAHRDGEAVRRLTCVLDSPRRAEGRDDCWVCRVALADLHRPVEVRAPDSFAVLAAALDQAGRWLDDLEGSGFRLSRDRAGEISYSLAGGLQERRS